MTFAQSMNIAKGYHEKKRKEFESNVMIMREPYALIYNMFAEKGKQKTPKELFPLEADNTESTQKKKEYIPASLWMHIFQTVCGDGPHPDNQH